MEFNRVSPTNLIMIISGVRPGWIFHVVLLATAARLLKATALAQKPAQKGAELVAKTSSGQGNTTTLSKNWRGVTQKKIL